MDVTKWNSRRPDEEWGAHCFGVGGLLPERKMLVGAGEARLGVVGAGAEETRP